ncbi:hypothetical protein [Pseudonocardia sp.]|uniref:hypothetical protein n=1 Tax=Pseudonocardia sp. TaxID=60912 RepID=UPI003D0E42D1
MNVHVHETARLIPHLYTQEQRATVRAEGSGGSVTLYATRDGLVRLRDILAKVVAQLDAARHNPAA